MKESQLRNLEQRLQPFIRFRVYPDPKQSRLYFITYVFSRKAQMQAFRRALPAAYDAAETDDAAALTIKYVRENPASDDPDKRVHPSIGLILLHRSRRGTGVVAHEMTHAALHYLSVIGIPSLSTVSDPEREEQLALAVGNLTRQFFLKY